MRSESWIGLLGLLAASSLAGAAEPAPAPPDPRAVSRGKVVYQRFCASCHGVRGDGRGPSAPWIDPPPRDFTGGIYEWRSTPSGTLPRDEDIARTITHGLHLTPMPSWRGLVEDQIDDLVAYLEHFSPRFASEPRGAALEIPPEPPASRESVARGQKLYLTACAPCHGSAGRGDGESAKWPGLSDEWGHHVQPRDLTAGPFGSGEANRDIYRVLMTGVDGTPMPSYAAAFTAAQGWDVVHYIQTLRDRSADER